MTIQLAVILLQGIFEMIVISFFLALLVVISVSFLKKNI